MVIFSHGFGVRRDDRGLFTDIAEVLDEDYIMFDYNNWSEESNSLLVRDMDSQVKLLESKVRANRNGSVKVIGHSQGCIVAAYADLTDVDKFILLAPPDNAEVARFINVFQGRPNTTINIDGQSTLGRSDGSVTIVPSEYWSSLESKTNLIEKYNELSKKTEVSVYIAEQDEVLGVSDFSKLKNAKVTKLNTNHNFTDDGRIALLSTLKEDLN